MVKHVVVDLETLSSRSDAAIVAIGAVAFDADHPPSLAEVFRYGGLFTRPGEFQRPAFYATVRHSTGHIDEQTVRWWLEQGDAARSALAETGGTESNVLQIFRSWLGNNGDFRVWAHATFDHPILGSAYARHSLPNGWPYRVSRDLRTIFEHAGVTGHEPDLTDEPLVPHHALHDAYREALALERAMNTVGWPN